MTNSGRWRASPQPSAQRQKASRRRGPTAPSLVSRAEVCSTPEGITTTRTAGWQGIPAAPTRVLNARRHHDDKNSWLASHTGCPHQSAQRQKASRRRRRSSRRDRTALGCVLNARRHHDDENENEDDLLRIIIMDADAGSSTPEGITTTRTRAARSFSSSLSAGAQRQKASRRREPRRCEGARSTDRSAQRQKASRR